MDDFNDSLDGMFDGKSLPKQERLPDTRTREQKLQEVLDRSAERGSIFEHECDKCGGTGFWRGNRRFPCFVCKGDGKVRRKTSPQVRAKAAAKRAEKRIEREADKELWRQQHGAEIQWLQRAAARNTQRGGTFDWPAKLLEGMQQYGTLTDGQLTKVQELMERDRVRFAESQAKRSSAIDATKVQTAFIKARETADRPGAVGIWARPLQLRAADTDLSFQPGSQGSQWQDMIFVKAGEKKLGSIKGGVFVRKFDCTDAEAAAVTQACEDPSKAAVAFGKAWGICCVCGRTLLNDGSIEAGIGPICAGRFGF